MKFNLWLETRGSIIYQDKTGYIKGYLRKDGYIWIDEFVIYPKYRGKKLAYKLAEHLPAKCKLFAYPLFNMKGTHMEAEKLMQFYEKLGFTRTTDEYSNTIMQKG